MPKKRKEWSTDLKLAIVNMSKQTKENGKKMYTNSQIATATGVPNTSVFNVLKSYRLRGTVMNRARKGRIF